ncbi:hypothetical protein CDD80_4024 [Ophiocordyceps camponoti-rufipedis]|uniref:Uncharacterized protein n=1 Tax=Ophiocordyceps camponoti-rufipedis TaxID=2004952 RepID=A0A2C5Z045_9HYPO|nr:hypothetical protein CDD80_4024 [Ophiocordyceps camponoti-rufipedis]
MQSTTHQVHDDLASLFSRTLTFNNAPEPKETTPRLEPASYSVSQHYHHSAHAAENKSTEAVVLDKHGIDAAVLTPSQMQLFRVADEAQKLRLMELWSIFPPARGQDLPVSAWTSSSLEHEERLARLRFEDQFEHQESRRQQQPPLVHHAMSLDGTPVQTADGTWSSSSTSTSTGPADATASSEPYLLSSFEEHMSRVRERDAFSFLGYTPATDPIYRGPDFARHQQHLHMAMQYGAAEHFREADAMDVM